MLLISFSVICSGADYPVQRSGELWGILSSKGQAWIEIKEDKGFTHRYLSPWQGGSPTNGGGFEKGTIELFDELVVGNRVWMSWFWDGHLRVNKIRVIKPSRPKGIFGGYLLEKGDKWFDVRSEADKVPWRFYVKWLGGLPENGGGYDTESLEFLDESDPNLPIRFSWTYDLRPRFDRFIDESKEDEFVPFYEGRTMRQSVTPPAPQPFNPFDQTQPVNPFDSVDQAPVNPFDTASPSPVNPFDQAQPPNPFDAVSPPVAPSPVNPFDSPAPAPANPFEQASPAKLTPTNPFDGVAPKQPKNPFEDTPLPGNPFDTLEAPDP